MGYLVFSLNKAHNSYGIRFHARDARNSDELFQFVSEKWNDLNINGEFLEKLVESMLPTRYVHFFTDKIVQKPRSGQICHFFSRT
jgi:hypothetical protein